MCHGKLPGPDRAGTSGPGAGGVAIRPAVGPTAGPAALSGRRAALPSASRRLGAETPTLILSHVWRPEARSTRRAAGFP